MKIKIYLSIAVLAAFLFLLFEYHDQARDIDNLKDEKAQLTKERNEAREDVTNLRQQYKVINEALSNVAEQKRKSDDETADLIRRLRKEQQGNNNAPHPVPDNINNWLRERGEAINRSSTGSRSSIRTMHGP